MNDNIKEVLLDLRKETGPWEIGPMKETVPGRLDEFVL